MLQQQNNSTLLESAQSAMQEGDTRAAFEHLSALLAKERSPLVCSSLGFCIAREQRSFTDAVALCREAIKADPKNSVHFYHLGRVHLLAGDRGEAIRVFRLGLRQGKNNDIIKELNRLGTRRPPVISFLRRDNPLNKSLGILLKKLGYR